jgi:hypothetical protein
MHRTPGAGGLGGLEGAMLETFQGVVSKLPALGTGLIAGAMMARTAIKRNHHCDGFTFPGNSGRHT